MHRFLKALMVLLLAGGYHVTTMAADSAKSASSDNALVLYQGADRHDLLVAAAKKEGTLTVYHAYPKLTVAIAAFTKKYGIKVNAWRAGSEAILQRVISEANGSRYDADFIQNNAPENEALHREKLLQPAWSPYLQELPKQAIPAHKEWVGFTLDVWTAAYNTNKVKKEDVPKSYEDLLDPKWKGKLGIEGYNYGWFGTLLSAMGEEKGRKLFSKIVATNGMSFRKGHSLLTNLVASGEVPLALTVYSWNPVQLKQKDAPIQGLALQPIIGQFSTLAIPKKAPHPAAAALFYDFMLNEGQKVMADLNFVVTNKNLKMPFVADDVTLVDPDQALDKQDEWTKAFETILGEIKK